MIKNAEKLFTDIIPTLEMVGFGFQLVTKIERGQWDTYVKFTYPQVSSHSEGKCGFRGLQAEQFDRDAPVVGFLQNNRLVMAPEYLNTATDRHDYDRSPEKQLLLNRAQIFFGITELDYIEAAKPDGRIGDDPKFHSFGILLADKPDDKFLKYMQGELASLSHSDQQIIRAVSMIDEGLKGLRNLKTITTEDDGRVLELVGPALKARENKLKRTAEPAKA